MSLSKVTFESQESSFDAVGVRVRSVRGELTQASFADRLGVARKTVVRWEGGEALPDGSSLLGLLREFGADPAWVLAGLPAKSDALGREEQLVLDLFRAAEPGVRAAVIAALSAGSAPQRPSADMHVVVHGTVGQQITGGVNAPQTINMGTSRPRKRVP